jgi:isoquinoline 1-oxidoreductase
VSDNSRGPAEAGRHDDGPAEAGRHVDGHDDGSAEAGRHADGHDDGSAEAGRHADDHDDGPAEAGRHADDHDDGPAEAGRHGDLKDSSVRLQPDFQRDRDEPDFGDQPFEPERYELSAPARYHFELQRREFLRIFSAVGGGLLVIASAPISGAQESGRARQAPASSPELSAWIHIGEDGRVTVYTGKVEIGQNVRTSLSQTVADELRLPLASVTLVMGDTDLTPYDMGTFGSMTTPRMAPQLARAAATAREMLIDQAAGRLQVDRSTLTAKDGRITAAGGRAISYGELTKGQKLTGVVADAPPLTAATKWSVRGTVAKKVDGRAFVTGEHRYSPDIERPGMLFGRAVRPDGYTGTLASIDDSRARALPGVTVVRDGDFVGVVAPTERAAKRAVMAVQAEWNVPPGEPTSETIYDHLKKTGTEGGGRGGFISGDVAHVQAAHTFEASYRIPYIAHVPLEPRAAVAEWKDGKLTVWTGSQRPFGVRSELAEAFRIPEERVRVIVPDTGAAYGGKHTGDAAIEAARLSKAAGRPVRVVWTREEEFSWGYLRPAGVIDIKAAVDSSGHLVSWEFDNWNSGNAGIQTPYAIPNQRIAFHPSRSPLRQGSYRGLAATANHYAREMHMDAIARGLSMDPVEFRLLHLKDERLRAVLTAVADRVRWSKRPADGVHAIGIASGTEKGSYVATAAEVSKAASGFNVDRIVIAFECGAIVNPDGLRNQVEGAVIQGLGGALFEAIEFSNGRLTNGTLQQYRVPRFKDVPAIETILLDRKDLPSAGAGETPLVCVAPAIGSGVRNFGQVDTALPVTLRA